jgi:hypothetical protein
LPRINRNGSNGPSCATKEHRTANGNAHALK